VTMWMSGVSSAARVSHTVRRSQNVLGTRVSDTSFFVTYLHKISILNHFRSRLKCVKLLLFFFFFCSRLHTEWCIDTEVTYTASVAVALLGPCARML